MPYKSKQQMRKFFAMEKRGELPKGKAKEWAHETPHMEDLPEKKRSRQLAAMKKKMKVMKT